MTQPDRTDPFPYGPATALVRQLLVALAARPTRDWIVLAHDFQRRADTPDLLAADRALGRAIQRAHLESARDAVVGPLLQIAHRVASAPDGAVAAASLDTEALAESALAAVLAVLASPALDEGAVSVLYGHLESIVPLASLHPAG